MIGVIVNTLAVIVGSFFGLIFKKGIPEKYSKAVMTAIALCVIYIGISGSLKCSNTLVLISSMVLGTLAGTIIDLDKRITNLGDVIEKSFKKSGSNTSIAEGFVTASLLFCVGAMAIVGSLDAGLTGNNSTLFTKSLLDMISAFMLTLSLGLGVMFSAGFIFIFQGAIALLAQFLSPVLCAAAINEITCAGSVMIMALGLNMLGITKIKVANLLPAILFVPLAVFLFSLVGI